MKVFNVLSPDLNVLGTHFLEASAGTGKTFAIEHLFVRLLLEDLPIDRILVVTFTRAAARELKMRIRSNVEKALHYLHLEEAGFAYLAPTIEKKTLAPRRKLEEALACFDQAQIFTIHGFCHRMLSEFAFEAKMGFGLSDPDSKEYKGLMRQHVKDFFRTALHKEIYSTDQLAKVCAFCKNDGDQLIESLIHLLEQDAEISGALGCTEKDPQKVLLKMARDCRESWEEESLQREASAPDEILKKMQEALKQPSFFQKVVQKYQAAIVDEFQDTDSRQWAIFQSLFLSEKNRMAAFYLVGDPKQSIYAFRNADLYTYFKAAEAIGAHQKAVLDTNFRSDPLLVEALNRLFASIPWMELPALKEVRPYTPVKARPGAEDFKRDDGKGAVHFLLAEAQLQGREKKWPPAGIEERLLFPFIAREIHKLHSPRIAVLVKDRFQSQRLHSYLKERGISSVIARGEDLKETAACRALEDLSAAVQDPGDLSAIKCVLGGALMGWSSEELLQEEKVQEARALFYQWQQILQEKGAAAFMDAFLQIAQFRSDSLQQLADLVGEENPPDLLFFFKEFKKRKEEERLQVRSEERENAVAILTTHMSKGLEFDEVFCLGIAFRHQQAEKIMRIQDKLTVFDAEDPLCAEALQEKEAEKMRQLYVALTRAKRRVYIPLVLNSDQKPIPLGQAAPIELFCEKAVGAPLQTAALISYLDRLHLSYEFLSEREEVQTPPAMEAAVELIAPPLLTARPPQELLSSFTSLSKKQSVFKSFQLSEEKSCRTLPLGAETGNQLHRLLEKIFSPNLKLLIQHEVKRTPLEGWEEVIDQILCQALHQPLFKGGFSLSSVPPSQMRTEMEFLFPSASGLIKGFADLCFEYQGKYYLLDWKSNWLGPNDEDYAPEKLEEAMRQNDYYLQASLYAEALHRYVKLFDMPLVFGGAFYYFLRGPAIIHFFPEVL